ncbi:MAG: energy-coupling factor ABC transporter ATP-binding protein [Spirochaetaceae bacterium]|jgi:energy-coupling factor transport system ATP-binding protein|nr:energy-coupling factor ABC transporter ATP-binding protein [Spirochaetaceae bacterium]
MLHFENVSFSYGRDNSTKDNITVENINFHIKPGDFVAMIGENGAGKSTIARLSNGLLKPSAGKVRACGKDTSEVKISALARDVAFLFQNPDCQICQPTSRAEIAFALDAITGNSDETKRRVDHALSLFSLDGEASPFTLSRGERQKIAVASLVARGPKLLILDEPTTGLDEAESEVVMEAIKGLNDKGTSILMITHDLDLAHKYAHNTITVHSGRIQQ